MLWLRRLSIKLNLRKTIDSIKWSTQSREDAAWYQHEELGYNYRMSNIIAGILRGQLPYLEEHIAQKKAIYELLKELGRESEKEDTLSQMQGKHSSWKLNVAIEMLKEYSAGIPVLYGSNQYIYMDGENKGDRHKTPQLVDLISHMTKNTIAGCTFVFNKALAQLIAGAERPDQRILRYRLHDAWMMLVAITCGKAIYDETSHMLYRIHSENLVGIKNVSLADKMSRLRRMLDNNS